MRCVLAILAVALAGALLCPGPAAARTPPSALAAAAPSGTHAAAMEGAPVVTGTAGADIITIGQNADGSLAVTLNGRAQRVAAADAPRLVVESREGDDTIAAAATVTGPLTIFGGAGDDVIDVAGRGALYADGGPDDDTLLGGTGLCQLFGGKGDDRLTARGTSGVMAGGPGADSYAGGSSTTQVYAQKGETVDSPGRVTEVKILSTDAPGTTIEAAGSSAFRRQVAADLTSLLSVPDGSKLLAALDAAGLAVSLTQADGSNDTVILDAASAFLKAGGAHGTGSAADISYDPFETQLYDGKLDWQRRPPIVGLVHELVHALNASTGTLQPGTDGQGVLKLELQAIGLPLKGIAFRWTPGATASPDNPRAYTENGFRKLLGLALRTAY